MIRKKSVRTALAVSAVAVLGIAASVRAQDEEAAPAAEQESNVAVEALKPVTEKVFTSLFKCSFVDGVVEVRKLGEKEWVPAKEGRYYPLGTSIRTKSELDVPVKVEISFGPNCVLWTTNVAEVATLPIELGDGSRAIELKSGRINIKLPRTLKDGLFSVVGQYFSCSNLCGESWFDYTQTGDGVEAVVHCKTGSMALEGQYYRIPRMGVASQVRIRSTTDNLFSSVRGESGDNKVLLSWIRGENGDNKMLLKQGRVAEKDYATGEVKEEDKWLESFTLSPKCAVKIFRLRSRVGANMVVSTMTFDAVGVIQNRFAFAEGRSNVNSGELTVKPIPADDAKADGKNKKKTGGGDVAEKPDKKADAEEEAPAPAEEPAPAPAKEEKPAADNGDSDI